MGKIKIIHFSDPHAVLPKLPEGDLYVCTGDVLENTYPPPRYVLWPQAHQEIPFQKKWIAEARREWAGIFPNRAPLLIVKGNHDYLDLKPLFDDGSREIYEFGDEPSIWAHGGLKFGGFRGVTEINGCWADECTERVLQMKCELLGSVDVLVTHGPARGCLNRAHGGYHIGSSSMLSYLAATRPMVHLFGHVHEEAGMLKKHGVRLSNAACRVNVIEV